MTERQPVDGCNCGCCAEVRDFRAAKRQVLFGCHCDAHPPEERCHCAFCVPELTADTITFEQVCSLFESDEIDADTYVASMLRDEDCDTDPAGPVQARADRAKARARCAEILNARASSTAGSPGYTAKVDELFAHCSGFGVRDFVDLAIAALDQAGVGERDQIRIRSMVDDTLNARAAKEAK